MAEDPLRNNVLGPLDIEFYTTVVDPTCLVTWEGRGQPVASNFYVSQFVELVGDKVLSIANRATQPNPDTILLDWVSSQEQIWSIYEGVPMESAPNISHATYLQVIAAIYTKGTLIDAGNPPQPCDSTVVGGTSTSCKPIADLELVAAPLAALEMGEIPIAALDQDETPIAVLTCKILS